MSIKDGWARSHQEGVPIDDNGNPLPWFTYEAIELLESAEKSLWEIFEYGCGFSTLWWSPRVKHVTSVEHDLNWYQKILPQIPNNVCGI